ncbi:hypothetical protein K2X33_06930 [bacterium]|nr:hypothetical protein [bacterium]
MKLLLCAITFLAFPAWAGPADADLESAISDAPAAKASPLPKTSVLPNQTRIPASAPTMPTLKLQDFFSTEKNPGNGLLEFTGGGATEKITFGDTHYVMGLVFGNPTLPPHLQAQLKKQEILQLVFGSLGGGAAERVAQFGSATFVVQGGKRAQRTLPWFTPATNSPAPGEYALWLFTSPDLSSQISEEEKLKNTFFGKEGTAILSTTSEPKTIHVAVRGSKLAFKMQSMRLEVSGKLNTPFVGDTRELKGTIEFPLYWPESDAARKMALNFANTSLDTPHAVTLPTDAPASTRVLSSKRPAKTRN